MWSSAHTGVKGSATTPYFFFFFLSLSEREERPVDRKPVPGPAVCPLNSRDKTVRCWSTLRYNSPDVVLAPSTLPHPAV